MRIIKFKGKDLKTGKWVYGDLHTLCDEPHIHTEPTHFPYAGKRSFINPDTIGQFTGLFDKNGKEIYEGDILLSKDEYGTVEVIFAHGAFQVRYFCKNGEHRIPFTNLKKDYELLGNIHDNPGLLNAVGYKFKENKEGGEE